jgi:hypothetical protein
MPPRDGPLGWELRGLTLDVVAIYARPVQELRGLWYATTRGPIKS